MDSSVLIMVVVGKRPDHAPFLGFVVPGWVRPASRQILCLDLAAVLIESLPTATLRVPGCRESRGLTLGTCP